MEVDIFGIRLLVRGLLFKRQSWSYGWEVEAAGENLVMTFEPCLSSDFSLVRNQGPEALAGVRCILSTLDFINDKPLTSTAKLYFSVSVHRKRLRTKPGELVRAKIASPHDRIVSQKSESLVVLLRIAI